MRERIDKTKPVPAPPGLKWTIMPAMILGYMLEVSLWEEDVNVDGHGMGWSKPLKKAIPNFAKGFIFPVSALADDYVTHERQIYRISKRVLKRALKKRSIRERVERYAIGEVHGG